MALLASAEGYTPRANQLIDAARDKIAPLPEVAHALADNLPAPKASSGRSRRRRRKRKKKSQAQAQQAQAQAGEGQAQETPAPAAEA